MAEWDDRGEKNRDDFPYSYCIEEEVIPRDVVKMANWLGSDEGPNKGKFFFERKSSKAGSFHVPPIQFNFSDETACMHFKLKYG